MWPGLPCWECAAVDEPSLTRDLLVLVSKLGPWRNLGCLLASPWRSLKDLVIYILLYLKDRGRLKGGRDPLEMFEARGLLFAISTCGKVERSLSVRVLGDGGSHNGISTKQRFVQWKSKNSMNFEKTGKLDFRNRKKRDSALSICRGCSNQPLNKRILFFFEHSPPLSTAPLSLPLGEDGV